MTTALIAKDGTIRKLDRVAESDERVTPADVQDPETLARIVQDLRKQVAQLRRAWTPRVLVFRDVVTTGSLGSPQTLRFNHSFGGAAWFQVLRLVTGGTDFRLDYSANSTNDTLILTSYSSGTFSLRVEEVG